MHQFVVMWHRLLFGHAHSMLNGLQLGARSRTMWLDASMGQHTAYTRANRVPTIPSTPTR